MDKYSSNSKFIIHWETTSEIRITTDEGNTSKIEDSDGRIFLLDENPVEEDYSSEGSEAQYEVLDRHFWFNVRVNVIVDAIHKAFGQSLNEIRLVEFGCSNGFVMSKLENAGCNVLGIDMHIGGLRRAKNITAGPLLCGQFQNMLISEPVDAVGFFDVLEHLDDDVDAVKLAIMQLNNEGHIIITVPALMSLWSGFDKLLGHKRRYTTNDIRELFNKLELEEVSIRYFFSFAVPIVWLQRKLLSIKESNQQNWQHYFKPPNSVINSILKWLGMIELKLSKYNLNPPFGSSIIAIGQKKTTSTS